MGSDCSYQNRPHEQKMSQKINIVQQSHPIRPLMQIVLDPRRSILNQKNQLSRESLVVLESKSSESKTQDKQNEGLDQFKKTKQNIRSPNNQQILLDLQTKPTLLGDQNLDNYNKQIGLPELQGSVLSKPNIKLNIECPSEARDSLISAWNKSNFNDEQFFKTVCFDTLFINQFKLVPKKQ